MASAAAAYAIDEPPGARSLDQESFQLSYGNLGSFSMGAPASSRRGYFSGCRAAPDGRGRVGRSGRRYDGKLLLLFGPKHPLRSWAISCVEDEWFDRLVLLLIGASCIAMASKDPLNTGGDLWSSSALEWAFILLFTIEMAIKMVAMGITPLESRSCYVSDGWNCLDGFIVLTSCVPMPRHQAAASNTAPPVPCFRLPFR